jgi:hypothetical protein
LSISALYDACDVVAQRVNFGQARFAADDDRNSVKFEPEGNVVLGLYCAVFDSVSNHMVVRWLDVCDPDSKVASLREAVIASGLAAPEGCELGIHQAAHLQLARLESVLQQRCHGTKTLVCKAWREEQFYYARIAAERVRRISPDSYSH